MQEKSTFNPGDLVMGTEEATNFYRVTTEGNKYEVLAVEGDQMRLKVLEHKHVAQIGQEFLVQCEHFVGFDINIKPSHLRKGAKDDGNLKDPNAPESPQKAPEPAPSPIQVVHIEMTADEALGNPEVPKEVKDMIRGLKGKAPKVDPAAEIPPKAIKAAISMAIQEVEEKGGTGTSPEPDEMRNSVANALDADNWAMAVCWKKDDETLALHVGAQKASKLMFMNMMGAMIRAGQLDIEEIAAVAAVQMHREDERKKKKSK